MCKLFQKSLSIVDPVVSTILQMMRILWNNTELIICLPTSKSTSTAVSQSYTQVMYNLFSEEVWLTGSLHESDFGVLVNDCTSVLENQLFKWVDDGSKIHKFQSDSKVTKTTICFYCKL